MTEEQYEIIRHDLNRLKVGVGIILALVVALIVKVGQIKAQTLMTDGRILVSVDTMLPWTYLGGNTTTGDDTTYYQHYEDSSNWWCEVVCDTVYDGSLRWDSTVFTGRDGKVFGTLYPCDTTWHRKSCLMVTPEEKRRLRMLLEIAPIVRQYKSEFDAAIKEKP